MQSSNKANYGYKTMRVVGPRFWNELPDKMRSLCSLSVFKRRVKTYFLSKYDSEEVVQNHFYISKLSICQMKMTASKMHTSFVPKFLPARPLKVSSLSNDEGKIKMKLKVCSRNQ